jgi:hypothetical protein
MLRAAYEAPPLSVSRTALLGAAKRFLLRLDSDRVLIPVDNIDSPDLGTSDLALATQDRRTLILAKLHHGRDFSRFAMQAAAYYLWLKEHMRISEALLNQDIRLDMYLFSYEFPSADSYLLKAMSSAVPWSFVKYQVWEVEGPQEPIVGFAIMDFKEGEKGWPARKETPGKEVVVKIGGGKRSDAQGLSQAELDEFDRLRARYLS